MSSTARPPALLRRIAVALSAGALVLACTGTPTPSPVSGPSGSATPTDRPTASATARPTGSATASASPTARPTPTPAPVEHRIGVRVVDGAGELFDRVTGKRYVARGANLVRLDGYHVTLTPGYYDPTRIEATLTRMERDGYNVVRVFHDHRRGGLGTDAALPAAYLDNTADLLRRAKAHRLTVMLTQDWPPDGAAYGFSSDPRIEDVNSLYLSRGGVGANARFFRDFAAGLVARGAPLDALLAYELRNELHFTDRYPPFSLGSGTVTTANGKTYDLSSADERTRMLEEGLVFWIDRMREAILAVDPTALVAVGFFQPHGPNPSRVGDDRLIETKAAILSSSADFIDLHGYPGGELDLRQLVENFGLPRVTKKPILLGEFGAGRDYYPTAEDAVRALVEWQIESCRYGFDGWLAWTWDSTEQPEFWNALDAGGAIERALSPALRRDPCAVGGLDLAVELTRGATARASRALGEGPAANAIDGKAETIWNAGAGPSQWLEIDLRAARTVERIRLMVSQYPAGATTHLVSVRAAGGSWGKVATLSGRTTDGQWLDVRPAKALAGIRYIRIETTTSPSWVAWREVSVLGSGE